jgi:hypothetical protein
LSETCPICNRRKAERFCPAKGEKICAVCCGTEREVTTDCPSDCRYLIAARRYESEHRTPLPAREMPFPDLRIPSELIDAHAPVVTGLSESILAFAAEHRDANDADVFAALTALTDAYRTLDAGLYYEQPPPALLSRELYRRLSEFLQKYQQESVARPEVKSPKPSDIRLVLAFLARFCKVESNGRPRSRAFLDFLRAHFGAAKPVAPEPARIFLP